MAPDRLFKVNEEVAKLKAVNFIREVIYPLLVCCCDEEEWTVYLSGYLGCLNDLCNTLTIQHLIALYDVCRHRTFSFLYQSILKVD